MKAQFKHLTKGEITASAIKEFQYRGFDCWAENNIAVRRRQFTGRYGKPDIIGFHELTGQFLGIEVKTINDTFSEDQILFLNDLSAAGGAAFIAYQAKTGQLKIEAWHEYQSNQHLYKQNGSKKTSPNSKTQK